MIDEPRFAFHDVGQEVGDGLSARALLLSMRRHLVSVLVLSLSFAAAGAVVGLGLPPRFQAESVLVIHSRPLRVSDVQEVLGDPLPEIPVIRSEVDVLESRSVIEPVVRSLALWQLPEFRKSAYPGGWSWQALEKRLRDIRDAVAGGREADIRELSLPMVPSDVSGSVAQAQIDETVEKYMRFLKVQTDSHSMTIRVSFQAWTPERAATIVNAHMESYQQVQVQNKKAAAQRANSWLTTQVAQLRSQLKTAETAVAGYREEHGLIGAAKDPAALSQQLAALNTQLIAAQADLAENEARAARIGASAKGASDSVPEVVASSTIQLLRGQEAQLVQREADLSAYHGDSYPELQKVRSSLRDLRGQISREIARGHAAALQLVERSRARERSIQQAVVELTKQVNSADAGLQQLEGNAQSIRTVLHGFEKRAEETAADPAFITSNSTVVSRANPSATSSSSKAPILAAAGGFVGLTLGGLLALFLEHRDRTFRTSTQVQRQVNSRAVGATPRAIRRGRRSPADIILDDNRSVFAEAFRLSWANLQLAIEGPTKVSSSGKGPSLALGITSAAPGEGKSMHALAFARTAALAGDRVVLVDADLRRSGLSRLLGQNPRFTLRDFLLGECTADDIIAVEERSGVCFVPSTPVEAAWTNQDVRRFAELIDYLKTRFALIIIDLPPILGLAETIRLTVAADNMALIIRWGRTERQLVQYALDALRTAGAFASAVILNDVDLKAQRRRGYYDRTVAYTYRGYRTADGSREPVARPPLSVSAPASISHLEAGGPTERARSNKPARHVDSPGTSDIDRLYDKYRA